MTAWDIGQGVDVGLTDSRCATSFKTESCREGEARPPKLVVLIEENAKKVRKIYWIFNLIEKFQNFKQFFLPEFHFVRPTQIPCFQKIFKPLACFHRSTPNTQGWRKFLYIRKIFVSLCSVWNYFKLKSSCFEYERLDIFKCWDYFLADKTLNKVRRNYENTHFKCSNLVILLYFWPNQCFFCYELQLQSMFTAL